MNRLGVRIGWSEKCQRALHWRGGPRLPGNGPGGVGDDEGKEVVPQGV